MKDKSTSLITKFLYVGFTALAMSCSNNPNIYSTSPLAAELDVLKDTPFAPNRLSLTGTEDRTDGTIINHRSQDADEGRIVVKDCPIEKYETERLAAIAEANADPLRKTMPVQFTITVGVVQDNRAYEVHQRSILRKNIPSTSQLTLGNGSVGRPTFNLAVDHMAARQQFMNGEKCFFTTVQVESDYQNRMPGLNFESADGVAKLIVADFRNEPIPAGSGTVQILNPSFAAGARRNAEYTRSFNEVFVLDAVAEHFNAISKFLSSERTVLGSGGANNGTAYSIDAYEGVPQLLHWLITTGLGAIVMPTTYTPLVLDLGADHIFTSSLQWGAFFDLANLNQVDAIGRRVRHKTAWLSGPVIDSGVSTTLENNFHYRGVEDGFLVLPNAEGKVVSSEQLIGSQTPIEVDGTTRTFDNGFLALSALAGKDCNSEKIQDRYLGPWDKDLYHSRLKIWVDENRNGVSEPRELKGLFDSGVLAVNSCYFLSDEKFDRHGNRTEHRAAFLYVNPDSLPSGTDLPTLEKSLVAAVGEGKGLDALGAKFRVIIDVFFATSPDKTLATPAVQ